MPQIEEMKDEYVLKLKLRDGAFNLAQALSTQSSRAAKDKLAEVRIEQRDLLEVCVREGEGEGRGSGGGGEREREGRGREGRGGEGRGEGVCDLLSLCGVVQDLCDIEDELETKLGVFKVHINGEQRLTIRVCIPIIHYTYYRTCMYMFVAFIELSTCRLLNSSDVLTLYTPVTHLYISYISAIFTQSVVLVSSFQQCAEIVRFFLLFEIHNTCRYSSTFACTYMCIGMQSDCGHLGDLVRCPV